MLLTGVLLGVLSPWSRPPSMLCVTSPNALSYCSMALGFKLHPVFRSYNPAFRLLSSCPMGSLSSLSLFWVSQPHSMPSSSSTSSSFLIHSQPFYSDAQTSHLRGRFHLGIGLGPQEAQQPCTGRSQSTAADCQVRHCTSFELVKTDCSVPGRTDSWERRRSQVLGNIGVGLFVSLFFPEMREPTRLGELQGPATSRNTAIGSSGG